MTEPVSSRPRLPELDALRGIAAIGVMLFHYTVRAPEVLPSAATIGLHVPFGEYGVQLFFAISGFVIFMTLEGTRSTADFAFARFSRLFPAYWAAILLTTAAMYLLGAPSLLQSGSVIAANFTMLQDFAYLPSVDGVYWSLTVELAFYLCMWALWRIGALGRIETILCAWIALRFVWLWTPELPWLGAKILLLRYIPFFAVGIAAYRVRAGVRRWRDQAPVLLAGGIAVATIDGAEIAMVYVATIAIFVALCAGRIGFLNRRVLIWLGSLSYPLYLVHQNIGYAIMADLESLGASAWLAVIAAIAAACGIAHAVHSLVEIPAHRMLRGYWRERRKRLAATTA